ncbi:pentraxin-related protein PTX3 [Astyanax mexicanus]|uniref:Pentraxin 3 n=1 Tax=Astyanax mexicanus TaxID=7994 RepID=A0A3B1JP84_ASTMX|nr:pentraxin-related protein PTX3 [Astyanax mexicanus]
MPLWRVLQAVCLVGLVGVVVRAQNYGDEIEVNYADAYYNEINEGDQAEEAPTSNPPPPCSAPEFSKWDKLFTMLENSQMKENMLLQYSDDLMKVELRSLRGEVLQFVAQYGGSCAAAVESAARRAGVQADLQLKQALDRLRETAAEQGEQQEEVLRRILEAGGEQAARLDRLENSCLNGAAEWGEPEMGGRTKSFQTRHATEDGGEKGNKGKLDISEELQSLREQLELYVRATSTRVLPAGCDMALFFPMRSPKTHAEIIPQHSMQTNAFTACLWVKPTQVLNKTVLFSYGTTTNPLELQLVLNGQSILFTVGGEAHLVEAQGAVEEGSWTHLCGSWSSEQGLASLWVHGQKVASSPGVAEGHQLPTGGNIILGQEYSADGLAKRFGFQDIFNAEEAFTGKMTGVNVWDRVLGKDEISQLARADGRRCGNRGNLVAWGVSQIVTKGGVELIF